MINIQNINLTLGLLVFPSSKCILSRESENTMAMIMFEPLADRTHDLLYWNRVCYFFFNNLGTVDNMIYLIDHFIHYTEVIKEKITVTEKQMALNYFRGHDLMRLISVLTLTLNPTLTLTSTLTKP